MLGGSWDLAREVVSILAFFISLVTESHGPLSLSHVFFVIKGLQKTR